MANTGNSNPFVILIAPNVSEQMGGEAIKSLQILETLVKRGWEVHQITHDRVRQELIQRLPGYSISYVSDTWLQRFCYKSYVFRGLLNVLFLWRANQIAAKLANGRPHVIVHITSPTSPVAPIYRIAGLPTVCGPLNANPYHPPAFYFREPLSDRLRRWLHTPAQLCRRLLPLRCGKQAVDALLLAGGERTASSLRLAGCRQEQFYHTLDSGIPEKFAQVPLFEHRGSNLRFVHMARLIPYKAADLAIKSLTKTKYPIQLDVIGSGPRREKLEQLVENLNLQSRVRLLGHVEHFQIIEKLREYRGLVLPSLAESNGIVVQEAMMLGLPSICLDWGGPADLLTPECGYLIPPSGEERVLTEIAQAMDHLAEDGELAQRMSNAGRARALEQGFTWPELIDRWIKIYHDVLADRGAAGCR